MVVFWKDRSNEVLRAYEGPEREALFPLWKSTITLPASSNSFLHNHRNRHYSAAVNFHSATEMMLHHWRRAQRKLLEARALRRSSIHPPHLLPERRRWGTTKAASRQNPVEPSQCHLRYRILSPKEFAVSYNSEICMDLLSRQTTLSLALLYPTGLRNAKETSNLLGTGEKPLRSKKTWGTWQEGETAADYDVLFRMQWNQANPLPVSVSKHLIVGCRLQMPKTPAAAATLSRVPPTWKANRVVLH